MSDQQPESRPAPLAMRGSADENLANLMDAYKTSYYSSFDANDPVMQSAVLQALNGETVEIKEVINVPIHLRGFLIRPSDPRVAADGEIQVYPVSLLFIAGGTVYRSGSRGVMQSLRLFEAERPRGLWEPPIEVVARVRNLGQGKNWIYLSRTMPQTPVSPNLNKELSDGNDTDSSKQSAAKRKEKQQGT